MKFLPAGLLAVALLCAVPARAESRLIVPPITKPHPRLILDAAGVAAMRSRALSGEEPFASAWKILQERLATPIVPKPYTGGSGIDFITDALKQGGRARDLALAFCISHDDNYARQSIGILRAWATALPAPGTAFDRSAGKFDQRANWGMNVARGAFPFVYAYDLLYNHPAMDQATRDAVEKWFRSLIPVIRDCQKGWVASGYYDRQYFNNHLAAQTMGFAEFGVVLGDRDLVQYAVDDPENPRDFRALIAGLILMKGDAICARDNTALPAPETGEIFDRYRHHTGKGLRGLQYCNLTISMLSALSQVVQTGTGLPLWDYKAPAGEDIRLPYEYYADFLRTMDSGIKSGYYKGETARIGLGGDSPALYELGLSHFPDSVPMREMLKTKNRAELSQEIFGPLVLTHGIRIEDMAGKK